jgi:hypothetical protein
LATSFGSSSLRSKASRGTFKVEGRIFPSEILLRVGYLENGRLKQSNLEVSIDFKPKDDVVAKIFTCVDALGSVFFDFFEALNTPTDDPDERESSKESADPTLSPGLDLPAAWKAFPFLQETVYIQYSTVNTDLETEADRLLGLHNNSLLHKTPGEEEDFDDAFDAEDSDDVEAEAETEDAAEAGIGNEIETEDEMATDPTPRMFGSTKKKTRLH